MCAVDMAHVFILMCVHAVTDGLASHVKTQPVLEFHLGIPQFVPIMEVVSHTITVLVMMDILVRIVPFGPVLVFPTWIPLLVHMEIVRTWISVRVKRDGQVKSVKFRFVMER